MMNIRTAKKILNHYAPNPNIVGWEQTPYSRAQWVKASTVYHKALVRCRRAGIDRPRSCVPYREPNGTLSSVRRARAAKKRTGGRP